MYSPDTVIPPVAFGQFKNFQVQKTGLAAVRPVFCFVCRIETETAPKTRYGEVTVNVFSDLFTNFI